MHANQTKTIELKSLIWRFFLLPFAQRTSRLDIGMQPTLSK